MMDYEFDIAVVGAGCVGASIFFELQRLGFTNMVLLDQGHQTVSATSQSGGLVRIFHESPIHREFALKNFYRSQFYRNQNILRENRQPDGSLYFFNRARFSKYQDGFHFMDQSEYPFEILNENLGKEKFPQLNWKKDELAIFEPLGNYFDPLKMVDDLLKHSIRQKGPYFWDNFEVRCVRPYQDRFRIGGEFKTISSKVVVMAGGARFIPRLQALGLSAPLMSQKIVTYTAKNQGIGPHFFDRENLQFARWGSESQIRVSDPKTQRMKTSCPWEILDLNEAEDCYAPGRQGIMGQVSGFPGLFVATGWGGTAFKFSLEIGHRVAQAVEKEFSNLRGQYVSL